MTPDRIDIDGLLFDDVTIGEATARIVELAKLRDRPRFVCTGNLDHLAIAAADREFRAAYEAADLVVADGAPVVWLSKLGGTPLKRSLLDAGPCLRGDRRDPLLPRRRRGRGRRSQG
jgi:UDP-N-acetyl-D-mannosaminuronic acid transferase (WecB/TagA/CpsF family)